MPNPVTVTCERTEQGWRIVCECGEAVNFPVELAKTWHWQVRTRWLLNHLSGLDGTHKGKERET